MNKILLNQYIYAILIAVIIQGCVSLPSDVVMPQWNTDLNVPFATKSYTLNDIIGSQNYISISSAQDSVYLINSDQYSQSIGVGAFIKLNTVGTVNVPDMATNGSVVEFTVPFPDNATIDSAKFSSGTLKITGHNKSATTVAHISISFPGIVLSNGSQAVLAVNVPTNSDATASIDLTGATYKAPSTQFFPGFDMQASASGAPNQVSMDAYTSDFVFSSISGYLPERSLGTQNNKFSLNLGDASKYRGKVNLKQATLTLSGKYKSSSPKPFIVKVNNLVIQGIRNSGGTMNLSYNTPLDTFRFDANGNFTLKTPYTESNSNITSFITFLPDVINISAEYIMNPDDSQEERTANSTDTVFFTSNFSTKSYLAIKQTSFLDTLKLDISQDVRDQILKGQGVAATANIQNGIPLTAWVKVTLTDQNYKPLFVVTRDTINHADSINFIGAAVDTNTNDVNTPRSSMTTINLDSAQINQLAQYAHYALVSVTVNTSGKDDNTPVYIKSKDLITLNVFGHVSYRIKGGK